MVVVPCVLTAERVVHLLLGVRHQRTDERVKGPRGAAHRHPQVSVYVHLQHLTHLTQGLHRHQVELMNVQYRSRASVYRQKYVTLTGPCCTKYVQDYTFIFQRAYMFISCLHMLVNVFNALLFRHFFNLYEVQHST